MWNGAGKVRWSSATLVVTPTGPVRPDPHWLILQSCLAEETGRPPTPKVPSRSENGVQAQLGRRSIRSVRGHISFLEEVVNLRVKD
jgi:hypothetical protein